jgi:hypothetical protein
MAAMRGVMKTSTRNRVTHIDGGNSGTAHDLIGSCAVIRLALARDRWMHLRPDSL